MTDEKYVFLSTSRERKRIAKGSYAKKGGSKSKKCNLPHESLTKKQLEERNGEVMTYKLDKPMKWEEFKNLPDDLKAKYINGLVRKYRARRIDITAMFGVTSNALWEHGRKHFTEKVEYGKGRPEQTQEWRDFIAEKSEEPETSNDTAEEEKIVQEAPKEVKQASSELDIDAGAISYRGKPAEVFERAYKALDENREYRITVSFMGIGKEE